MHTVMSTRVDEHTNTHPPTPRVHVAQVRRVAFPDRVALHVGLALVTWSRRPRTLAPVPSVPDEWTRNERARERAEREARWLHALYLSQPRR
jgi:hypothetical protein